MDDFFVYGSRFENYLQNLTMILQRCKDKNLALNWEKCHFMLAEGIVLGHKISVARLEVDEAKISMIKTLRKPVTVKGIISFLGHARFYGRFIKDLSMIAKPLCRLLEKDAKFDFQDACKSAFYEKKARLVISPVIATLDWSKNFEIMCDASDFSMRVVLG